MKKMPRKIYEARVTGLTSMCSRFCQACLRPSPDEIEGDFWRLFKLYGEYRGWL